jgi:hypothetical protein
LQGSSWITCDEDGAEAAAVVIGTTAIIGTGAIIVAIIVAITIARAEPGIGKRRLGGASEYAPRPCGVGLAVGMVGIERLE